MNFLSDNASGIAPGILQALIDANQGMADPYGKDVETNTCQFDLSKFFGTEVEIFSVATGTAANALALSAVTPPHGAIFCHESSHINVDEAGAPEFFTHGAKLIPLAGRNGKLSVNTLEEAYGAFSGKSIHQVRPAAVSITQPTEWGVCYSPREIQSIARFAGDHGLALHMDGARFFNAIAYLECGPDEITWRAGVDILSLGFSKNGAAVAELVVFFDQRMVGSTASARKRSGHLISKSRYLAAQVSAMLRTAYWQTLAGQANAMAHRLAHGLAEIEGIELFSPVEANLVFARFPSITLAEGLMKRGARIKVWCLDKRPILRLVCSFNTELEEVNEFLDWVRKINPEHSLNLDKKQANNEQNQ